MRRRSVVSMLASLFLPAAACRRRRRSPSPDALRLDVTPRARVSPTATLAGRPVAVHLRWDTGPGFAGADRPYRGLVQLVTSDGVTLVEDVHDPQPPARQWRPARSYEYTRVLFTHRQFPGPLELRAALVDPADGSRPHLDAAVPRVVRLDVGRHAPDDEVLFFSGFGSPWTDNTRPFEAFRWMGREGIVACGNPRVDAVLFLRAQRPDAVASAPVLTVAAPFVERRYVITTEQPFTIAVRLDAPTLGREKYADVTMTMDSVFPLSDGTEAGLRVDRVALCPASEVAPEVLPALTVL